jgi:hypothetical protein
MSQGMNGLIVSLALPLSYSLGGLLALGAGLCWWKAHAFSGSGEDERSYKDRMHNFAASLAVAAFMIVLTASAWRALVLHWS